MNKGAVPLYRASRHSHVKIVKILMEAESDVNKVNNEVPPI